MEENVADRPDKKKLIKKQKTQVPGKEGDMITFKCPFLGYLLGTHNTGKNLYIPLQNINQTQQRRVKTVLMRVR